MSPEPHPLMFDDDDPVLARVREVCLRLPGATETVSHGRPWFSTRTGFCVYGGSPRGATRDLVDQALVVKVDPGEREALLDDGRFWEPAYLWNSGWLGLDLARDDTDWGEVAELVEASYRLTAPKTLVRELDER